METSDRVYKYRNTTFESMHKMRKARETSKGGDCGTLQRNDLAGGGREILISDSLVGRVNFVKDHNYLNDMREMVQVATDQGCFDEAMKIAAKLASITVKF